MIEATQKYQTNNEHDEEHHGQCGKCHGVGAEIGDIFDVGGEGAETTVLFVHEFGLYCCCIVFIIIIIVGLFCWSQDELNNWFNCS